MLFAFCSFSARFWRRLAGLLRWPSSPVFACALLAAVPLLPWLGVFLVLRALCFVRVPRPRVPRGWGGVSRCYASWVCVAPSALPALRASSLVFFVVPAVVCRRSGVVLRVWAWCSFWGSVPEHSGEGGYRRPARCAAA
jgi:hypothetical protein